MIRCEEYFITSNRTLCCEFFPDETSASIRQKRLQPVMKHQVMLQEKKNLKTPEGLYKTCWMVSYLVLKDNLGE